MPCTAPAVPVVITSYVAVDAPAFATDLAKIRRGMVEAELLKQGVDLARIEMASAVAEGDHAEKGDVITVTVGVE